MVNRRDIELSDLLFSAVFGATFSFKLQMLHDMRMNPLTQPLEYAFFFGYSIIFIIIYWKWIRPVEKKIWLDPFFALVSSLAPYPALQIALLVHGIRQEIYDLVTAVTIVFQLVAVYGYHKCKQRKMHRNISKKQERKETSPRDLSDMEKLRVQRLISELSSRENSTLVFSTVAASASLAILIMTLGSTKMEWFGLAFWMGFLFSLAGFSYREATIFSIDRQNYKDLNKFLSASGETTDKSFRRVWSLNFFRMVVIRLFLLIPAGNWILIAFHIQAAGWVVVAYLVLFVIAFYLSLRENDMRCDP